MKKKTDKLIKRQLLLSCFEYLGKSGCFNLLHKVLTLELWKPGLELLLLEVSLFFFSWFRVR